MEQAALRNKCPLDRATEVVAVEGAVTFHHLDIHHHIQEAPGEYLVEDKPVVAVVPDDSSGPHRNGLARRNYSLHDERQKAIAIILCVPNMAKHMLVRIQPILFSFSFVFRRNYGGDMLIVMSSMEWRDYSIRVKDSL